MGNNDDNVRRTQIVCLCEGKEGSSIDGIFIHRLLKNLKPKWLRPWEGSNWVRVVPCGGRNAVIEKLPSELKGCQKAGAYTTLMVWADCDDDCDDGESLKKKFWEESRKHGVNRADFEKIVFIFSKDRLENWIEFIRTGKTDESKEGPRVKYNREAADAAGELAKWCKTGKPIENMPQSMIWSCKNWRSLVDRMSS